MPANETLEIPERVRLQVYERDELTCQMCGRWLGERACIHHIEYGMGMGARRNHDPLNLAVICNWPGDPAPGVMPCHARAHNTKFLWQPYLLKAVVTPGVTAMQLRRWAEAEARRAPGRHLSVVR